MRVFHIEKGFSFPCKFRTTWSLIASRIILLVFSVSLFHWTSACASDVAGFGISVCVYSNTPSSSRKKSILSFQAQKFEVKSNALSSLNPLKYIFPTLKRICSKNCTNRNFSKRRSGTRFLYSLLYLWYHVEMEKKKILLLMNSNWKTGDTNFFYNSVERKNTIETHATIKTEGTQWFYRGTQLGKNPSTALH